MTFQGVARIGSYLKDLALHLSYKLPPHWRYSISQRRLVSASTAYKEHMHHTSPPARIAPNKHRTFSERWPTVAFAFEFPSIKCCENLCFSQRCARHNGCLWLQGGALTFALSRIEPFPSTDILAPVSSWSLLMVLPWGPKIFPTKLNWKYKKKLFNSRTQ